MKKALVLGGAGFIGNHLVTYLKEKGYWVRAVDINEPKWGTDADQFKQLDLRNPEEVEIAFRQQKFDEVYQLAADMGGMGFIHSHELDCLTNNVRINLNCLAEASKRNIPRYFYSSSVCIYPDMKPDDPALGEDDAYPAQPDNEYGWEKLYSERVALSYAKHTDMQVRIARFQNCFGEKGTYEGGREKAPAALCRKVALANDDDEVEVWGDGTAVRNYIYVADLVDGIYKLMQSDIKEPTNIGTEEYITVNELLTKIINISEKFELRPKYIDGPVGVQSRNFKHDRIKSTGWEPKYTILEGLVKTYEWIEQQVTV